VLTSSLTRVSEVFTLVQTFSFGNGDRRTVTVTIPAASIKTAEFSVVSVENAEFDLLPRFNDLAVRDGISFAALRVTGIDGIEEVSQESCDSRRGGETRCVPGHELARPVSAIQIALPSRSAIDLADYLSGSISKPLAAATVSGSGWATLLSLVDLREDPPRQWLRGVELAAGTRYHSAFEQTAPQSKRDPLAPKPTPKPRVQPSNTIASRPSFAAPQFTQPFDSISKSAGTLK
jgi:hypothetical protein